jgi:hypothetical protein
MLDPLSAGLNKLQSTVKKDGVPEPADENTNKQNLPNDHSENI